MRLRQVALAAHDLEPVVAQLQATLDLEVAFRDPGVATFGLHNAVLPVGDAFLEVVSPVRADAPAARWLARHGGDGGYMVIVQCEDLAAARRRVASLGVRIVFEVTLEDIATLHLHPRDVGGAILSLDESRPPASWRWAGPDWPAHRRTQVVTGLAGAVIAVEAPERVARRWAD
ncbi:MAG: VOC family protein, partial [Myxococcota bacterium]|nr:VOC family protein [Myxococcota bacterium]